MKFENVSVYNFENAIRGARNALESWEKIDSFSSNGVFKFGDNDLNLCQRLINAGSPSHRKFLRQIFVSVDITAPMYWWSEFDTYKVGTVANSTSKMHKLASTEITPDKFEFDSVVEVLSDHDDLPVIIATCNLLENYRQEYLRTKDKRVWRALIQLLPESWLQKRTVTLNYENLYCMIRDRKGHKLIEWHKFIDFVGTLPYSNELLFLNYDKE